MKSSRNQSSCQHSQLYRVQDHSDERGLLQTMRDSRSSELPFLFKDFYSAYSLSGVFRGLHVQMSENPPKKLVRVLKGSITAFSVCLNSRCLLMGEVSIFDMGETIHQSLVVSPRQAFGYYVNSNSSQVLVGIEESYMPHFEMGINPMLLIKLGLIPADMKASDKDLNLNNFPNLILRIIR